MRENLLDGAEHGLPVQPHETDKLAEIQTPRRVVVHLAQQQVHLIELRRVTHIMKHVVELHHINVVASILVELRERLVDLVDLLRQEAVGLLKDTHEVHERVEIQFLRACLCGVTASLFRILDHLRDAVIRHCETQILQHQVQLVQVNCAGSIGVVLLEGLTITVVFLVAEPPRPHQRLGEVQAERHGDLVFAIALLRAARHQLLAQVVRAFAMRGAEELDEHCPQLFRRHHLRLAFARPETGRHRLLLFCEDPAELMDLVHGETFVEAEHVQEEHQLLKVQGAVPVQVDHHHVFPDCAPQRCVTEGHQELDYLLLVECTALVFVELIENCAVPLSLEGRILGHEIHELALFERGELGNLVGKFRHRVGVHLAVPEMFDDLGQVVLVHVPRIGDPEAREGPMHAVNLRL
mmetsp:Transcript_70543/g.216122  ORF Transcript_70543/g.216122 Transcript_70543/m.216122 type:complete len:409 (-) Transcript_70543:639-1865(-)